MKLVNAFCTANFDTAKRRCDALFYCGNGHLGGANVYVPFAEGVTGNVYLDDMLDEQRLAEFCDHIVTSGARAIVRAAFDINEAGKIEAAYKLSPIMLLHKLGVLGSCTIAGGVCLDNDDLDLMAQENVPLVLTPTASAGYGHGFAPVVAAVRRGLKLGIGTFDGKYNTAHDVAYEAEFLRLTANAEMSTENALDNKTLARIAAFE